MKLSFLLSAILASLTTHAQTYLVHANLVDPVTQKTIPDQTIVYKGADILRVGAFDKIRIPKEATVIDVTGKWVMPGLVDAHVHFFQSGGLYTRPDAIDLRKYKSYEQDIAWSKQHMEEQLRRYLAIGITTVIDDGDTQAFLQQRDSFATKPYAPRIYMAGPLISTAYDPPPFDQLSDPDKAIYGVASPEQALQRLKTQYPYHPDFIKIWYIVLTPNAKDGAEKNLPTVKATITEAHSHGYKIAVHATERITAQLAVEAGADFLVHDVEDEVVDAAFIDLLKTHHVVLCPTLVVMSGYFDTFGGNYTPTPEDISIGDPGQLASLQDLARLPDTALIRRYHMLAQLRAKRTAHEDSVRKINLKKMADAGVVIATGTDAGNIGTLHASSFFKEIRAMQEAGLTNWQIITASTVGGAKSLGKDNEFGSIRPGLTADMLILSADPTTDLANLRKLETVIHRGVPLDPNKIMPAHAQSTKIDPSWWKEAIVYQIYPRSFKDSDGDGIGDLKGIISRLDYIQSLGVTAVWLNPIYSSPNDDNGYDVSNYRDIMKDFGTMDDFDQLLKDLHARGIRLIMDLVVNHTSDEHEWFRQSRSSRTSPYRKYYHWWNAENGKPPYRYSLFDVNHDAWRYDSLTDAYYLHYFSRKQPDLNWENPQVRKEVYDIMRFWADKGIDGFRLDAFQFVAKDTTFPSFPKGFEKNFTRYYAMQGNLHGYLQEMNSEVLSRYNIMSVAEGAGNNFEDAHNLVDADRKELNMAYAFDGVDIPKANGYSLLHLKEVFSRWDSAFAEKGWLSIFLANHDQARMVSRFGNDKPPYRALSSKMLSAFILTMRGTPYCYNGDELGMTNAGFTKIEDYRDVQSLNEYQHIKNTGGDLQRFIRSAQFGARDNGRTPFQWDAGSQGGFTTGAPWIKVNPNYTTINAAIGEKDPGSCLNFFKQLVLLRKSNPILVYGSYQLLDKDNPHVYAYTRTLEGKKMLILLNFTDHPSNVHTGISLNKAKLLLDNYGTRMQTDTLRPYEAAIYLL